MARLLKQFFDAESIIRSHVQTLSDEKQASIRSAFSSSGGFALAGFPSFSDVVSPFPLPTNPLPPVKFPPFPPVNIPVDVETNATRVVQSIEEKVTGLVGGALETVRGVVVQLPLEAMQVVGKFADRITATGKLFQQGILDQAIANIFESVVLLARDIVALALATVVNLVIDVLAGVIGGLLFARPLTPGEKEFAQTVFHGQINLTFVRVAIFPKTVGLTSANVVWMRSMDLSDPFVRGRFPHELTHVHQDQRTFDPATLRAAHEYLNHNFGSRTDPYEVHLTASSSWNDLGVEQQAQVVENFQKHLDSAAGLSGASDPIPAVELTHYRQILASQGFF